MACEFEIKVYIIVIIPLFDNLSLNRSLINRTTIYILEVNNTVTLHDRLQRHISRFLWLVSQPSIVLWRKRQQLISIHHLLTSPLLTSPNQTQISSTSSVPSSQTLNRTRQLRHHKQRSQPTSPATLWRKPSPKPNNP